MLCSDDVVADRVAMIWNKSLNEFFVLGRHLCISIFLLTQHVKGVGPMLRGNADIIVLQPIFQHEARLVLADLYAGWLAHNDFFALMDEVVYDVNLEGSTPQEPKKDVRTMIISDFENTIDPQLKFHWNKSENPEDYDKKWRLLPDVYWKEAEKQKKAAKKAHEGEPFDPITKLKHFQHMGLKSKFA
jgi:hypothetical protein